MSAPRDDAAASPGRPARGRLGRPAPASPEPPPVEASEVLQGQAAAVLGALARMQLRLDVLAREQSDLFAQVLARLDQIAASSAPSSGDTSEEPPRSWEPS